MEASEYEGDASTANSEVLMDELADSFTVEEHLRFDLIRRSAPAAAAFSGIAGLALLYPLTNDPKWLPLHNFAAYGAITLSLIRLVISRYIVRGGAPRLQKFYGYHFVAVVINAMLYSMLFSTGMAGNSADDRLIFTTVLLMSLLAAGSTSSIALDFVLQLIYISCVIIVPFVIFTIWHFNDPVNIALSPAMILIFVVFLLLTSRQFRQNMTARYSAEKDLQVEKKNLLKAIQELKVAQDEVLKQKAGAQYSAKLASLGEMAAGIAHEINTPLAAIQLRTESIVEALKGGNLDNALATRQLQSILTTVGKIAKIISGLKAFARDGKGDPLECVSLRSVIEDTLGLCAQKFSQNNIKLEFICECDAQVKCRATEILQVLINLFNNSYDAVQALPEKWVRVMLNVQGNVAHISVTDSGKGIPPEIREKIMQPFFTTKAYGQGTGLGLSISKGLVENNGGDLRLIEASPNTCFDLSFQIELKS